MADSPYKPIPIITDERNIMESPRIVSEKTNATLTSDLQETASQPKTISASKSPNTVSTPPTQTKPPPTPTRPHFLTLPTELRYQIYKNIITPTSGTIDLQTPGGKLTNTIPLLNTTAQIRNETLYIIYTDIPLSLSLWNYPLRKQKIKQITNSWSYLLKSLWREIRGGPTQKDPAITPQEITQATMYHERSHAIALKPGAVVKFRDITLNIDIDEDVFRYAALEEGMQIWLHRCWISIPRPSHHRRRIVLDFRYKSGGSGFRYEWYIPRIRHAQGLPLFSREAVEECFEDLVLTWRDCHVGVCRVMGRVGDAPVGVEVVVRNVDEIDGFGFEFVEEGEKIEGRFFDLKFDERVSSEVDGGTFVFIGGKLSELKCNYTQKVA